MALADIEKFLEGPSAPSPGGSRAIDEFLATPPPAPTMGQRASQALGTAHRAVGDVLRQIDTLGGRLPGTPSGSFVTPETVNPVARNLPEAGVQAAMVAAGPLSAGATPWQQALTRVGLGSLLGGAGMAAEGRNPVSAAGAKEIGAPLVLGEVAGWAGPRIAKTLPGVKSAINEAQSQDLLASVRTIDPDVAATMEAQQIKPTLKGGQTFAKMRQAVTGGAVQDVASQGVQKQMTTIDALSGSPRLRTPTLEQAYKAMPPLARQQLVGAVDPEGFSLPQAQQIRGWLGSKAFAQSPQGQGVGPVPQQKLWAQVTTDIERALSPVALPLWKQMNLRYGGTMAIAEPLGESGIVQGLPNRLLMNRNYLSQWLDQNREDITRRVGPRAYDALVEGVLGGAQPGTRDLLTPGSGMPSDAFQQTFGRRTNTGATGFLGVPLGTVAPNLGSQYTGRFPLNLPPAVQQALDLILQRQMRQP